MRKLLLKAFVIGTSVFLLSGCNSKNVTMTADDAEVNEIVITSGKKVQSVIKEAFDKKYYKEKDLKEFIKDDLESFNANNGTNIKLNSMKVKKKNVYVVLDYKSADEYNEYNDYQITTMDGDVAKDSSVVPSKLVVYGKNKKESKKSVLKKGMKVVVVQQKVEVDEEEYTEDEISGEPMDITEEENEGEETETSEEEVVEEVEATEMPTDLKVNFNVTVAGKIKYVVNAKKDDRNSAKVKSLKKPVIIVYE